MTSIWRSAAFVLLLATAAGVRAQPVTAGPVTLVVPPEHGVVWRGISAEESAGSQGAAMLYPAPNVGGLLAAIFTHALIVQGTRESERSVRQAAADRVLEPHAEAIARLTPAAFTDAVVSRLKSSREIRSTPAAGTVSNGVQIEMRPTFALTIDRRTILLDNAIKVQDLGAAGAVRFENIVRVVAAPRKEANPQAYWVANDGRALVEETVRMAAHSIELALTTKALPDGAAPFRTQRYRFGAGEKMERGQVIRSGCARVVLKTLREWLMSVPVRIVEPALDCADPYRIPAG
jgi:hypothetical protein